jgi:hypothetical protein
MSTTEREFNLQPTPRILPMLGEIKLPEWRCVAELVDNAVDGFLGIRRAGEDITAAQIHVNIPLTDATSPSRIPLVWSLDKGGSYLACCRLIVGHFVLPYMACA